MMSTNKYAANILFKLHAEMSKLPLYFRERVCEECNYSMPSFYRKMRGIDKRVENKLIPALSNAEKQKICEIAEEVTNDLCTSIFGQINK